MGAVRPETVSRRGRRGGSQALASLCICAIMRHDYDGGRTSMATIKTVGRSGQIALGKEYAGRSVLIDELEPGVWIIKLGQFIPDSERWLDDTQVRQEVEEAIAWAERNPPRSTDLEALAAHL